MDPSTQAVTAGRGRDIPGAPVNVAVPITSTYRADGPIAYGREGNEMWSAL
jgi:cystathionine gamma-synthase